MASIEESKVAKFGGSSIATREDVGNVAYIVNNEDSRRFIVLSAPGRRWKGDAKVTDMLISYSKGDESQHDAIVQRYENQYPGSGDEVARLLAERHSLKLPEAAYRDAHAAAGEELNARQFAREHGFEYVDPQEIISVSGDFGNAGILPESTQRIRDRMSDENSIYIIPGFFGYTKDGQIATLSRGGSDTTGAWVASALNSAEYENFTDSPILAASPDLVDNPRKIDEMTFEELRDLSVWGFDIVHSDAVIPVQEAKIPMHIRSTKQYPEIGTYVYSVRINDRDHPIVGVAYKPGLISMNISKPGLDDITGVIADVADLFRDTGINLSTIPSGVDDISFVFGTKDKMDSSQLHEIAKRAYCLLGGNGTEVSFRQNLGNLVVAGIGIKDDPYVSPKVHTALVDNGVEIVHQSQGAFKRSLIFGIPDYQAQRAVRTVYDKFINNPA